MITARQLISVAIRYGRVRAIAERDFIVGPQAAGHRYPYRYFCTHIKNEFGVSNIDHAMYVTIRLVLSDLGCDVRYLHGRRMIKNILRLE